MRWSQSTIVYNTHALLIAAIAISEMLFGSCLRIVYTLSIRCSYATYIWASLSKFFPALKNQHILIIEQLKSTHIYYKDSLIDINTCIWYGNDWKYTDDCGRTKNVRRCCWYWGGKRSDKERLGSYSSKTHRSSDNGSKTITHSGR